jgi:diguanylate cyclase (GGDEF)-like protein
LIVTPLLLAAAVVGFVTLPQVSGVAALTGLTVAIFLAFMLGRALGLRATPVAPTVIEPAVDADVSAAYDRPGAAATTSPGHSPGAALVSDATFLSFIHELIASTDNDGLRTTIQKHLPAIVGRRVVWITSHLENRRQVIVSSGWDTPPRGFINADGQEWTTFPLRVEQKLIGVMGIDSNVPLPPELKEFVQTIAPVIAQAVNRAHVIEGLKEAGLVDLLTGAATRREGLTRLRAEMKRANRTGESMAVLMLDLDRFKSINDRFGHASGDALLTAIGRTTQTTLRASDIRCRWGGEEFLIVLPDTDLTRAQVVAAGLLHNIASTIVPTPAGLVSSTVSIGMTICRPGETDVEAVIRRADMALYKAKESGRACVRVVLGDRDSNPIGVGVPPHAPRTPGPSTLPFPDRRNPLGLDRRGVPHPGRRSTDRPSGSDHSREQSPTPDARQV